MKAQLGEDGTQQFTVETHVNGIPISVTLIHDPFLTHTISTNLGWWRCLAALFAPSLRSIKTQVVIRGSGSAQRAIMTLDPEQLSRDTEEILEQRRVTYESAQRAIMALDPNRLSGVYESNNRDNAQYTRGYPVDDAAAHGR